MQKYESFEDYLQINYLTEIKNDLIKFIEDGFMEKFEITKDNYYIQDIRIREVEYTKSKIDLVEFNVWFKANIGYTNKEGLPLSQEWYYFSFPMRGSFKKGFKPNEKSDIELMQEEKECLSNSLVPIIHSEEMDKYANKFLKYFCPEALESPIEIDVDKILIEKGLTIYDAPLGESVHGKIFFAKDKTQVFDEHGELVEKEVEPGTILLNPKIYNEWGKGSRRNTLIHEAVHWFFHRNYFELRQCLDPEATSITCYRWAHVYENEDIAWMEWQARSLAPKILMPKKQFLAKLNEAKENNLNFYSVLSADPSEPFILQEAVGDIADFFGVSKQSAKYRLNEVGEYMGDGVFNYVDGAYIEPFMFKKNSLKQYQTFVVSDNELAKLLNSNFMLRDAIFTERLLYVNKMLVVNNSKYVDYKTRKLTDYALTHAEECCVIFSLENKDNICNNSKDYKLLYLENTSASKRSEREVDTTKTLKLLSNAEASALHYLNHKDKMPSDFPGTLEYHIKKSKKYNSYEALSHDCDVNEKTIRNYKDGKTSPSRENILKIALALKLSPPYIIDLLQKADQVKSLVTPENTIIYSIIFGRPRRGLMPVYEELYRNNQLQVLDFSKNWISEHPVF